MSCIQEAVTIKWENFLYTIWTELLDTFVPQGGGNVFDTYKGTLITYIEFIHVIKKYVAKDKSSDWTNAAIDWLRNISEHNVYFRIVSVPRNIIMRGLLK